MKTRTIALAVLAITTLGGQLISGAVTLQDTNPSTSIEAPQTDPQPCTRAALTIKEGETDAAMGGVRRTPYTLTNVSKTPCVLKGHVSLELLNKAGAIVKRATKQKTDDPITAAILEPGKTAWFALNFNAGGAGYMGKPCPVYRQMKVTTPGAQSPFVLKTEIQTCAKSDFSVTPITAGAPE